jgi:hypothetical protein
MRHPRQAELTFTIDTVVAAKVASRMVVKVICNLLQIVRCQEVYNAARRPKNLLEIDGYCHGEASVIAPLKYYAALHKFLGDVGPKGQKVGLLEERRRRGIVAPDKPSGFGNWP